MKKWSAQSMKPYHAEADLSYLPGSRRSCVLHRLVSLNSTWKHFANVECMMSSVDNEEEIHKWKNGSHKQATKRETVIHALCTCRTLSLDFSDSLRATTRQLNRQLLYSLQIRHDTVKKQIQMILANVQLFISSSFTTLVTWLQPVPIYWCISEQHVMGYTAGDRVPLSQPRTGIWYNGDRITGEVGITFCGSQDHIISSWLADWRIVLLCYI